jgi:hypothetical protein
VLARAIQISGDIMAIAELYMAIKIAAATVALVNQGIKAYQLLNKPNK